VAGVVGEPIAEPWGYWVMGEIAGHGYEGRRAEADGRWSQPRYKRGRILSIFALVYINDGVGYIHETKEAGGLWGSESTH
jgi:hypothetical protein